jgi:hypothetical protein
MTKKCDWFELEKVEQFISWTETGVGKYVEDLWRNREAIQNENLLFFDMEFSMLRNGERRPKVVVWFETNPPVGVMKYDVAWWNDRASIKRLRRAFRRADHVVAYDPSELDYRVLKYWKINVFPLLSRTIDIYRFFFEALSILGTGNLSMVSQLNGGPGKVVRVDASPAEFLRQCDRDLEMLLHVFDAVLSGRFRSSKFGTIDLEKLWPIEEPLQTQDKVGFDLNVSMLKAKIASALRRIVKYLTIFLEARKVSIVSPRGNIA